MKPAPVVAVAVLVQGRTRFFLRADRKIFTGLDQDLKSEIVMFLVEESASFDGINGLLEMLVDLDVKFPRLMA